jgi:hypothetical protein
MSWFLLMSRNGFPNNANVRASSIVDLPSPFLPTIRVEALPSSTNSLGTLPVERKFFHDTVLKISTS